MISSCDPPSAELSRYSVRLACIDAAGTPLSGAQSKSLIHALVAEEGHDLNPSSAHLTPQQMKTYSQVLQRASSTEPGSYAA